MIFDELRDAIGMRLCLIYTYSSLSDAWNLSHAFVDATL